MVLKLKDEKTTDTIEIREYSGGIEIWINSGRNGNK